MLYDVDPAWRSTTVVDLCKAMHHTGDFSGLPVLADALEEAGCAARDLLDDLRGRLPKAGPLSLNRARRLVCEVAGGELAAAVAVIESFALRFPTDDYFPSWALSSDPEPEMPPPDPPLGLELYDRLIDAVAHRLETGEPVEVGMNQAWPHRALGEDAGRMWTEFWAAYRLVTGKDIRMVTDIFTCVC